MWLLVPVIYFLRPFLLGLYKNHMKVFRSLFSVIGVLAVDGTTVCTEKSFLVIWLQEPLSFLTEVEGSATYVDHVPEKVRGIWKQPLLQGLFGSSFGIIICFIRYDCAAPCIDMFYIITFTHNQVSSNDSKRCCKTWFFYLNSTLSWQFPQIRKKRAEVTASMNSLFRVKYNSRPLI